MRVNTFAERLQQRMLELGITAAELSRKMDLNEAVISQYKSGRYEPKQDRLEKFAKILEVNEAWLMGYDVDKQSYETHTTLVLPSNIVQISTRKFPLLGEIACGEPIFADEQHETYIESSKDIHADFCLIAKGDSMINARIHDGDVVFIRQQSIVDNGDIAAVIINDEATLKRWYYYPEQNKLVLSPENSKYPPFVFTEDELNTIRCLGKAVCFMSNL